MEQFTIPQSLAMPDHKNIIKEGFKIHLMNPLLGQPNNIPQTECSMIDINDFWPFLIRIFRCDYDSLIFVRVGDVTQATSPSFYIYKRRSDYCVFTLDNNDGGCILVPHGRMSTENFDFVVVQEALWGMSFMLPRYAFVNFQESCFIMKDLFFNQQSDILKSIRQNYEDFGLDSNNLPALGIEDWYT